MDSLALMSTDQSKRPVTCENCGANAPIKDARSPSGANRLEDVQLSNAELADAGWVFSGTGWLCPECASTSRTIRQPIQSQ